MSETNAVIDNFSLLRGGPTYRLLRIVAALWPRRWRYPATAMALMIVTWVPLAWLSARDGVLSGGVDVPLLGDYYTSARLLLALPWLVVATPYADQWLRRTVRHFHRAARSGEPMRARQNAWVQRVERWRDAFWPEVVCLLLAIWPAFAPPQALWLAHEQDALTLWQLTPAGESTPAGEWLRYVAAPLFRFVALLWLWRFVLWTCLLAGWARTGLPLRATHADGAGGLGFLGLAQGRFAVLSVAGGLVLCGACLNQLLYLGHPLSAMRYLLGAYVLGSSALVLSPLLLLVPAMARHKRRAMNHYGRLGLRMADAFEHQRLASQTMPAETLLQSPSPSAMADFGAVHATVSNMALLPLRRWDVAWVLVAATLPLMPLAFFGLSLDEVMQRLASLLL